MVPNFKDGERWAGPATVKPLRPSRGGAWPWGSVLALDMKAEGSLLSWPLLLPAPSLLPLAKVGGEGGVAAQSEPECATRAG